MKKHVLNMSKISVISTILFSSCGNKPTTNSESSELASLKFESGTGNIYYTCLESNCKQNEIRFYHNNYGYTAPYLFLATEDGHIHHLNSKIMFTTKLGQSTQIGTMSQNKITALCNNAFEKVCDMTFKVKNPTNDASIGSFETGLAVYSISFGIRSQIVTPNSPNLPQDNDSTSVGLSSSKTELLKYIIASPNQEDAGSCHYMANTGAMEILLNKSKNITSPTVNGNTDLSERYLMGTKAHAHGMQLIKGFNGQAALNSVFPYINTKGTVSGSARANWNNSIVNIKTTNVPQVKTKILAGTMNLDDNSKWSVANFNSNTITKIKQELDAGRPVIVNYNHFNYWHVVVIVGYDDQKATSCSFEKNFINSSNTNAVQRQQASTAFNSAGGCKGKGIFYVRDSLGYSQGNRAAKYDERSYQWLEILGSKAFSVEL